MKKILNNVVVLILLLKNNFLSHFSLLIELDVVVLKDIKQYFW